MKDKVLSLTVISLKSVKGLAQTAAVEGRSSAGALFGAGGGQPVPCLGEGGGCTVSARLSWHLNWNWAHWYKKGKVWVSLHV